MHCHKFNFRIYFEDTDAAGVVYYANYLRFAERARVELFRSIGFSQSDFIEKEKMYLVVQRIEMDFKKPARLDDYLEIETKILKLSGARIEMEHKVRRYEGETLAEEIASIKAKLACVNTKLRPTGIPESIRNKLESL